MLVPWYIISGSNTFPLHPPIRMVHSLKTRCAQFKWWAWMPKDRNRSPDDVAEDSRETGH